MYVNDTTKRRHFVECDLTSGKMKCASSDPVLSKGKRLVYEVAELVLLHHFSARCTAGWWDCFLRRYGGAHEVEVIKVVIVVGLDEGIMVIFYKQLKI